MSWDHRFAEPIVLPDGVKLAHPCARISLTSLDHPVVVGNSIRLASGVELDDALG
jgi:hypothetical protein